eukprot:s2478_g1.t1
MSFWEIPKICDDLVGPQQDFKTPSPTEAFDPVAWLNARLARSHVPFDKLDQHLSSLGMSCQLLCQDTSEAIELASNQLVAQLSASSRGMEKMRQEASWGSSWFYGTRAYAAELVEEEKDSFNIQWWRSSVQ